MGTCGEVRRLLAKGMVLLAGNEWTDALDFEHSLTLRADRAFVDTSHPFTVRISRSTRQRWHWTHSLTAHASVRKAPAGRGGGAGSSLRL